MKKKDFSALLNAIGISEAYMQKIALQTGFQVRKGLVQPLDVLYAFCQQSVLGTASYNDLAAKIDAETGVSVSRQAIAKKACKETCTEFLKKILALVILAKVSSKEIAGLRQAGKFKRVLIQDSTIIGLPARLFNFYSGVANGHARVCNARIQCVYDLLEENFILFSVDTYSKNDLAAAPGLVLQKDDLVIRDRGYLSVAEIERHLALGAHCIFRHKSTMAFFDVQTKNEIELLPLLRAQKQLDIVVTLKNEQHTQVRLIAFPVTEEIANCRRMKAKKEMKKAPSKEYLEMLGWSIFVTTIAASDADYNFIFKAYSLRWRIEIIFKSWKSNMAFAKIHNVSKSQLLLILYARFIMIIICIQHIFSTARPIVKKLFNTELSMIKVVRHLMKNTSNILLVINAIQNHQYKSSPQIKALAKYCSYDKRKRKNFEEQVDPLFPA